MSSQPFPIDIVLVRHGESEGNFAQSRSAKGDDSCWTEEFKQRHSSRYRLTSRGVQQAKVCGEWIQENIAKHFDRYYCSEYTRAMETAAYLGFPDATWFSEFFLREQDQGVLAGKSLTELKEAYAHELERRSRDVFYYQPPGGESIANLSLRVELWLSSLRQHSSGFSVVAVVHGNTLKAARILLERLKQEEWSKLDEDPHYIAYNGQVVHYSRRNPTTGRIHNHISWVRTICPWDTTRTPMEWRRVCQTTHTAPELLRFVDMAPRLIDSSPDEEVLTTD